MQDLYPIMVLVAGWRWMFLCCNNFLANSSNYYQMMLYLI